MPPKSSQKPKPTEQPAPATSAPSAPPAGAPAPAPARPLAKRVRKPAIEAPSKKAKESKFSGAAAKGEGAKKDRRGALLDHDAGMPVDVTYEGESVHAKVMKNGDGYRITIKLMSPCAFSLVKSTLLTTSASSEYAGCQAILLRPAKSFPFLKLPKEARAKIYSYYFAPGGVLGAEIPVEGRRTGNKDLYAKSYAEGSKVRVGLLTVCKEIFDEAIPILYENRLRFETTTTLNDFLVQLEPVVRARLRSVVINTWVKTTSRNTMLLLCESRHLKRLHIESNLYNEGDPAKAAKYFWGEAGKLLDTLAAAKAGAKAGSGAEADGEVGGGQEAAKEAAVGVVTLGSKAMTFKDDGGKARAWGQQLKEEFWREVRGKMK